MDAVVLRKATPQLGCEGNAGEGLQSARSTITARLESSAVAAAEGEEAGRPKSWDEERTHTHTHKREKAEKGEEEQQW